MTIEAGSTGAVAGNWITGAASTWKIVTNTSGIFSGTVCDADAGTAILNEYHGVDWANAGTFTVTNSGAITIPVGTTITIQGGSYYSASNTVNVWAPIWAPAEPAPLNHRGAPVRSHFKDSQFSNAHPAELIALQLLRKMIPAEDFRRYLRHGFVTVRGASGLCYQIPRDGLIIVWDRGERLCSLCIHMQDRAIPPTDEVVAKMLIVECDEPDIWKRANKRWIGKQDSRPALRAVGMAA